MRVIIESHLQPLQFSVVKGSKKNMADMFIEFNGILQYSVNATSLRMLSELMGNGTIKGEYFACGFGASHFWVHQRDEFGNVLKDILLIVTEE